MSLQLCYSASERERRSVPSPQHRSPYTRAVARWPQHSVAFRSWGSVANSPFGCSSRFLGMVCI
jgi:hypothetical protein